MEEITMEKLLTDLNGVIAGINELVEKKDIEGARKVLKEIENSSSTAIAIYKRPIEFIPRSSIKRESSLISFNSISFSKTFLKSSVNLLKVLFINLFTLCFNCFVFRTGNKAFCIYS